ncbi:hypothetical protein EYF80_017058 [Liparis tanakae]|uniref:Uncharacterized protein n=1 Tax=Liparis tanakae TaxID=230148 RepID=A0A4Z2I627_9TELE|nr:hypothetical protein EYF80_017058 [Liparis tanakae]
MDSLAVLPRWQGSVASPDSLALQLSPTGWESGRVDGSAAWLLAAPGPFPARRGNYFGTDRTGRREQRRSHAELRELLQPYAEQLNTSKRTQRHVSKIHISMERSTNLGVTKESGEQVWNLLSGMRRPSVTCAGSLLGPRSDLRATKGIRMGQHHRGVHLEQTYLRLHICIPNRGHAAVQARVRGL